MTREEADALIKGLPPLEDPVEKWKREADEVTERRAAAKRELLRQERAELRERQSQVDIADRLARLERGVNHDGTTTDENFEDVNADLKAAAGLFKDLEARISKAETRVAEVEAENRILREKVTASREDTAKGLMRLSAYMASAESRLGLASERRMAELERAFTNFGSEAQEALVAMKLSRTHNK